MQASPSSCFSRCFINATEVLSKYNWVESICDCSGQCKTNNQTIDKDQCCVDYDDYCSGQDKISNAQFEAFMQSLGLKHSHLMYAGIVIVGIIFAVIGFVVYRKRNKPLTIQDICDNANGSLLEMTSSASSSNERSHMMHWDELYEDFIDFSLAETVDSPLEQRSSLSMYSNIEISHLFKNE